MASPPSPTGSPPTPVGLVGIALLSIVAVVSIILAISRSMTIAGQPAPSQSSLPVVPVSVSAVPVDQLLPAPAVAAVACGKVVCGRLEDCVEGSCCPRLRACLNHCCKEHEMCNVYQCYQPLFCGRGLPACPSDSTYCEDYDKGKSECNRMGRSWAEKNKEACERYQLGAEWIQRFAKPTAPKNATGTCFPVLPPHRLGGRWYRVLGAGW